MSQEAMHSPFSPVEESMSQLEDSMPVGATLDAIGADGGGGSSDTAAGSNKEGTTPSPSKKWKRGVISPEAKVDSTPAPTAASALYEEPLSSRLMKAAKRIKTREDSRAANDLMKAFALRAAKAAGTAGDATPNAEASSSSNSKTD